MKSIARKIFSILTLILVTALSFAVLVPALEAHADTALDEIRLLASTSKVMEGDLPMYSVGYASDHVASVEQYGSNTGWLYWETGFSSWHGFGTETPVAVPDGTTHYALRISVTLDEGYSFADNTAIYLNDVNMTEYGHTMAVNMGEHSGYVYIDLGTAGVWPPRTENVTVHTILVGGGGTYEVTYDTDNVTENMNTALSSSSMYTVPMGTEMMFSAEPAVGYYFAGWYTAREIDPDGSGNMAFLQDRLLTTNLFLEYTPEVDEYLMPVFVYGDADMVEVTVNVNGGNAINPNTFQGFKGEFLTDILERSGVEPTHSDETKTLIGICADSLCETELDGDYVIFDDMTVYLKWVTLTPHELTYNLNYYGDERDIHVETVYEEVPVQFVEDPTIEGMTFDGWFEDPECQVFFEYGDGIITEDKTIYAYWRENIDSIELTVAAPHVGDTVTLTYNEEFEIDEPNIVPNVTSASENYGSHHPDWVMGVCSAESNACNELFSGTFEADTDYYARIDIHAEDGYALTTDTLDHITVNGEAPAEIFTVYGRTDTMIIARLRSSEEEPAQSGPYTVHFVRYTGSGEMEDIIKNAGEELTFPECDFTAPNNMIFNAWYIDDEEGRSYFWPGDTMVINNNVDVVVDWTQENFVGTFSATISAPMVGHTITEPTITSGSDAYTVEITEWYEGNDLDSVQVPLDSTAVFAEGTYVVGVRFTLVGDYRVASPVRALINDRRGIAFIDSGTQVSALIEIDTQTSSDEPGEPEQPVGPEYTYRLTRENTTNLEVLYETDIEELVGQKKQKFFSDFGDAHGLNLDALFSIYEPYKYADYKGYVATLHCYDVADEEVSCNGHESRRVYDVEYYYDEITVTRKTTVTVQFNTNGGGGMDEIEVTANQPMDEPEEQPERAGYSFAGWSKDEAVIDETTGLMAEGKALFNFDTPLTGETTLVANWKKVYEVSFAAGVVLPVDRRPVEQLVVAGNVPAAPVDTLGRQILMEYDGFTLEGYYYDAGYENRYEGQPIVADTILHIKWHDELDDYIKINEVNLTLTSPVIGTVVTMDGDDWDTQTPQPTVTVPEGANYSLDDAGGDWNYAYWLLEKDYYSDPFLGTMVKGGTYYAEIYITVNSEDYWFDQNVVVKVNGVAVDAEFVDYDGDLITVIVDVTPAEVAYTILEGANQIHSIVDDADKDIVVKASGDLEKLDRVEVDGAELGEGDGDITAGSTVVTLKADYLNALALGVHTLKFVYNDGEVATNFTIVDPRVEESPFTADESGMFKIMFVISLVGLSFGWLRLKSLAKDEQEK